jgi:hypothetical protein
MAFIEDTFTDADGTRLEVHSPDIGLGWTKANADASSEIWSDQLSEGNDARYVNEIDPPTADYEAFVTTTAKDNDYYNHTLLLRWDENNQNGYAFQYRRDILRFQIIRIDGGSETVLAESDQTYQDSFPWTHKAEIVGNTLTQYKDGGNTQIQQVTDSTYTTAGKFGFHHGVCALDDLQVNDLGSPGTIDDYADITTAAPVLLSGQITSVASESPGTVGAGLAVLSASITTIGDDQASPTPVPLALLTSGDTVGADDSASIVPVGTVILTTVDEQQTTDEAAITAAGTVLFTAQITTTADEQVATTPVHPTTLIAGGFNLWPKFGEQRATPNTGTGIVEVD